MCWCVFLLFVWCSVRVGWCALRLFGVLLVLVGVPKLFLVFCSCWLVLFMCVFDCSVRFGWVSLFSFGVLFVLVGCPSAYFGVLILLVGFPPLPVKKAPLYSVGWNSDPPPFKEYDRIE